MSNPTNTISPAVPANIAEVRAEYRTVRDEGLRIAGPENAEAFKAAWRDLENAWVRQGFGPLQMLAAAHDYIAAMNAAAE